MSIIGLAFAKEPPKWSGNYFVRGILYFSNGEIEEPFTAWYDEDYGRSRIDYYDGIVSTYQISRDSDYGKFYRIIPVTSFEETNKRTCYEFDAKKQNGDENDENNEISEANENSEKSENTENTENNENLIFTNERKHEEENISSTTDDTENEITTDANVYNEPNAENEIDGPKNSDERIKPQSVLPNCENFKYAGEQM